MSIVFAALLAVAVPAVVRVDSAHHGVCPPASNRFYRERAAKLFSKPLEYNLFFCGSHSEAQLLGRGCGTKPTENNTVFVTFDRVRDVQFVQEGHSKTIAHVRTFGETWEATNHRAIMYFPSKGFPKLPPPPGYHAKPYAGPDLYALFGIEGDPLGLASGECPA